MKWTMKLQPLTAAPLLAVFVWLTATTSVYAAVQQKSAAEKVQTTIQSVQVVGDDATAELLVTTSAPVTYTSYKTTAPTRLIVDFSQAVPIDGLNAVISGKGAFKGATLKRYDTDAGMLTRMEIELVRETEVVISPVNDKANTLRLTFPGYTPASADNKAPVVATTQQAPEVATVEQGQMPVKATATTVSGIVVRGDIITIQVNGVPREFKTFRLNKPERVVIDVFGAKSAPELKIVQLNAVGIATARVGSYADKVRIVLDALNGGLSDATIERTENGIDVRFAAGKSADVNQAAPKLESGLSEKTEIKNKDAVPAATPVAPVAKTRESLKDVVAQVEAVDFQALEGISRVAIKVSGAPAVDAPVKSAGFVSFKIKNAQLHKALQRSYETREFNTPVLRITPIQVRTKNSIDTVIRVAMRSEAEYELRRETDIIYLDFKHQTANVPVAAVSSQKATQTVKQPAPDSSVEQQLAQPVSSTGKRIYTGRKVTLEFADAEVRKIFQLLSEVSNKNFVLGDEVTGTISLKLVNVPWDQALDIILDTKGLDKREDGNIILIRGKGKFKSLLDEELEIRKTALKSEPLETAMFDVNYAELATITAQFGALKTDRGTITQDSRTNKVIVKDVKNAIDDMRTLLKSLDVPERQVMIEARIVEATTAFTRSLGVNWGIHYRDGSASIAGINSMDTTFGGLASNVPTSSGTSGQPGAAAGISFGTLASNIRLDMRLNAAVSAGLIRIVSTPRVATLNHKSAKITQGQQIPYTSSTSDKIETKFVEAALALEVTPHINPNGTIVLKIDAKNDAPGSGNPPPINKKQATTEMMLRDGETTVIGGIYVERDINNEEGVPFLKDVPFFGGLFKSDSVEKTRTELLIFITPKILVNG